MNDQLDLFAPARTPVPAGAAGLRVLMPGTPHEWWTWACPACGTKAEPWADRKAPTEAVAAAALAAHRCPADDEADDSHLPPCDDPGEVDPIPAHEHATVRTPTGRGWVVVCGGLAHRTGPCWLRIYHRAATLTPADLDRHGWGWTWDSSQATFGTEVDAERLAHVLDAESEADDRRMWHGAIYAGPDPDRSRDWILAAGWTSELAAAEGPDGRLTLVQRPGGFRAVPESPEGRATAWATLEAAAEAARRTKLDVRPHPADAIGWGDHVAAPTAAQALTLEV